MADSYLNTIRRLEPDITPIDLSGGCASIAISLKRIADSLDTIAKLATVHGLAAFVEAVAPIIAEMERE